MRLILGLTVCFLQGERGHKGFKVREALFFSLSLSVNSNHLDPPSTHCLSICISQGDKGFRGRDGTDGRKASRGETSNAALTFISGADVAAFLSSFFFFVFVPIREKLVSLVFLAAKDLQGST